MRFARALAVFAALAGLHPAGGGAQDLYVAKFRADCLVYNTNRDRVASVRISERSLIAAATGLSLKSRAGFGDYALVYNRAEGSLQVVHRDGTRVADVARFRGGAALADQKREGWFAFMFAPGQTNSAGLQTNLLGTAIISERLARDKDASDLTGTNVMRTNITGRLQYLLSGGMRLGETNFPDLADDLASRDAGGIGNLIPTNSAGTNLLGTNVLAEEASGLVLDTETVLNDPDVRICLATFTANRPFEAEGAGASPGGVPGGQDEGTGSAPGPVVPAPGTNSGTATNGVVLPPSGTGLGLGAGSANSGGSINTNLPPFVVPPFPGGTNAAGFPLPPASGATNGLQSPAPGLPSPGATNLPGLILTNGVPGLSSGTGGTVLNPPGTGLPAR